MTGAGDSASSSKLFTPCNIKTTFVPLGLGPPQDGRGESQSQSQSQWSPILVEPPEAPAQPPPCKCQNCVNRESIAELIKGFEDRKSHMLFEIGSLKSLNSQLEVKTALLDTRIEAIADLVNNSSIILAELYSKNFSAISKFIPQQEATPDEAKVTVDAETETVRNLPFNDPPKLNILCPLRSKKLESDMKLLKKFAAVIDKPLLGRLENLKKSLEEDKKDIESVLKEKQEIESRLQEAYDNNCFMTDKIRHLETLVNNLKNSGSVSDPGSNLVDNNSLLEKLDEMRKAFNTNENLMEAQEQELEQKTLLLCNYERFVYEIANLVGHVIPNQEVFFGPDVSQKLNHLCDCVMQALADNGLMCKKLEALQRMLQAANKENALLNETVASLNEHIDALSCQNNELLFQINQSRQRRCKSPLVLSNMSSPRSDSLEGAGDKIPRPHPHHHPSFVSGELLDFKIP